MTESEIRALANIAAERVAKNAGVAEQLCFPHIYLTLKDALGGPAPALAGDAQPATTVEVLRDLLSTAIGYVEDGGGDTAPMYAAISAPLPVAQDAAAAPCALTQAQIDHIGEQWDGCMYDAPGMFIDIGQSIRIELAKLAAAVPAVAQDAQDIRNATPDEAAAMFFDSRKDSYVARTLLGMKSTATGGVQSLPAVAPQEQSAPDAEESEAWNTLAASEAQEAIAGSQAAAPVTGGSIDTAEFDDLIAEIWCATLDGKRGGKAEANLVAHIDAHTAQAVAQARGEVAAHQKAHVDQLKAQIAGHEGMFDLLKRERDSLLGVSVPEGWRNALHAAVSAIYFDDNSDYKSALVSVVRHLSPELASELLSSPKAAYEKSQAILATKEPQ